MPDPAKAGTESPSMRKIYYQTALLLLAVMVFLRYSSDLGQNTLIPFGNELAATIAPKVFIFAMFDQEASNWLAKDSDIQFEHTIVLPGLSRGYDKVYYTADGDICLLIVGTALINAALSTYALTSSPMFDLRKTYFILSGISGVNPKRATIGSVSFAKFAIQMDTQLEWDSREIPSSWITGYAPLEGTAPDSFPGLLHGSEVYELNEKLQQLAISFAKTAKLHDTPAAEELRVPYRNSLNGVYKAALTKPMVLEGDVASSNVFFHGRYICEGVEKLFKIYTSGQADYVMTANEDTAILTALLRAAIQEKVDFGRVILTRAGCNFDREAVDDPPTLPFEMDRGGVAPATRNLYLTGVKIAFGIVKEWEKHFDGGIETKNYVGDVFGSLGREPDFIPKKPSL
ncbi:hypothetical protein TWF694_009372 [Orbilia ellipsospora]|uniref:Purine nucleoside permease n=1 Tax=Orbilia ellipsospora TaxID=2528407 RepID=A0AAV9XG48_9PEZI